ncbi:hemicentin-1 isoform X2 [Copidosoma floridanum]|uniref:hemicentin-1 isoform X2 n=1 Tax=Copidosoma floridanum TaxID=29053 RepID=UPI0006C98D93|nr:hemicentin-1 isoform X2 [Copidosoma floridanum]
MGFRMDAAMRAAALVVLCLGVSQALGVGVEETQIDTHEGSTVKLQCRFGAPRVNATYYWLTHTNDRHDSAAVEQTPLAPYYTVYMKPEEGRYDLEIRNVSYERDNGKYECRVKVSGTGENIYHKNVTLTVLRAPSPPYISSDSPSAKEGERMKLQCNTQGGSPEPEVKWYRGNSNSVIHTGKTYEFTPTKDDDRQTLRCVVRNRAMKAGETLSDRLTLDVSYSPRVSIGSENPLRVELNSQAVLKCNVDSKPEVGKVKWIKDERFVAMTFNHEIQTVTLQDAGKYTCQADNGLSKKGESFLFLDVQYAPTVSIEGERVRTAEVEDPFTAHCNVSSNPPPTTIEWLREGRPEFRIDGPILRMNRVTAEHVGNYTCRATNTIHPSGGERKNYSASARVELRVRHKPGPARITPDSPIATEGNKVILTCVANPPGYPEPQFRWSHQVDAGIKPSELSGSKYEINSVHLADEGTYKCHAFNEIGNGESASVNLTVHKPPNILTKLQPHLTRKVGESSFQVSCVAQGKPRPSVRWLKDDTELTSDQSLYKVTTTPLEGHGRVVTVNSTLSFLGNARPETDKIVANDRGKYTCVFDNEVKNAVESQMMLKVEHSPINLNLYDKVANNLHETANVTCKVQAWPKPEFQWSFGTNLAPLQGSSSDGHYEISTTSNNDYDLYTSVLKITNIRETDYGDYSCRAINIHGSIVSSIKLQPKGAPERPNNVRPMDVGPTHVALVWDLGFDGGLPITKYFVSYRRVASGDEVVAAGCAPPRGPAGQWSEIDCRRSNPCNVSDLEQHQTYTFKVKVYNTNNHSDYSDEVMATTAVARIPSPQRVSFDPESGMLAVNVDATCLGLVASIEKSDSGSDNTWRIVDDWGLEVRGSGPTLREDRLRDPAATSADPRIRVRLCLKADRQRCGEYTEAEIGPSYVAQAGAFASPTTIAFLVSGSVSVLFGALFFLFCRCRKRTTKAKDYEMDSNAVRPSLVTANGQQTQAPPPYYAENKALEHSLDHALALEDSKTPAYGQSGYGYHQPNHNMNGVNMGYMENSYSNSNNGGSVNSQDSIWQMKSAAVANGVGVNGPNVGMIGTPYDMGGYGTTESDYPTHPHYLPQRDDYRESHNLSRQQFCEPFAPVVKTQKHVDSPYDVSGLPYQENYDEDAKPPQQVSLAYDESLESGYSTPNSRGRRIIREIIV